MRRYGCSSLQRGRRRRRRGGGVGDGCAERLLTASSSARPCEAVARICARERFRGRALAEWPGRRARDRVRAPGRGCCQGPWPPRVRRRRGDRTRRRSTGRAACCGCRRRPGGRPRLAAPSTLPMHATVRANAAARLSMMHRTSDARSAGGARPACRTACEILAGMSPGGRNTGSSTSNCGPPDGTSAAAASNPARSDGSPACSQRSERLLEQPQPHDVTQVADPAIDAELVREVGRPTRLGQDRPLELDSDEGPRPARDVGEVRSLRRDADDRRCRVVRSDVGQLGRLRESRLCHDIRAQGPDDLSRTGRRREDRRAAGRARRACRSPRRAARCRRARSSTRWSPRRRRSRSASSR